MKERMAYIGKCSICGTVYFKAMDLDGAHRDELADDLREVIADGDTVERVTLAQANAMPWADCHCRAEKAAK